MGGGDVLYSPAEGGTLTGMVVQVGDAIKNLPGGAPTIVGVLADDVRQVGGSLNVSLMSDLVIPGQEVGLVRDRGERQHTASLRGSMTSSWPRRAALQMPSREARARTMRFLETNIVKFSLAMEVEGNVILGWFVRKGRVTLGDLRCLVVGCRSGRGCGGNNSWC